MQWTGQRKQRTNAEPARLKTRIRSMQECTVLPPLKFHSSADKHSEMLKAVSVTAALCAACLSSACVHISPARLKADQVDYARRTRRCKKALRFSRPWSACAMATHRRFSRSSSIIAAYTFDAGGGATGERGLGR